MPVLSEIIVRCLEFLSEHEVEVAATLSAVNLIEAVAPVNTHHTNHWQIDTGSNTCRALQVEWIELTNACPRITSLNKYERIDSGAV